MPTDPIYRRFVFYWEGSRGACRVGVQMPDGGRVVWSEVGTTLYTREQWEGHAIRMVVVAWIDPEPTDPKA